MLQFDSKGHLTPYKKINLSLIEFQSEFVKSFPLQSSRHDIFKRYLSFIEAFRKEITDSFTHWIDGSFTTKKMNPSDIDFVTIINKVDYDKNIHLIEQKYRLTAAKEEFGKEIDAYTVKKIPKDEKGFNIFDGEKRYWMKHFSETKPNRRTKKKSNKGFIEITFNSVEPLI